MNKFRITTCVVMFGLFTSSAFAETSLEQRVSTLEKEVADLRKKLAERYPDSKTADARESVDTAKSSSLSRAEMEASLRDLPILLSQARAVPYFRDGSAIGFRLFAIRQGSAYERMGLQNGDIVLKINGEPASDATKVLKLVELPPPGEARTILLERDREVRTLTIEFTED